MKRCPFFSNDFTEKRWRKAALKLPSISSPTTGRNMLLGSSSWGKLWDAVEVCISKLNDLQLALVIVRLYEGDGGLTFGKLLKEMVLGISSLGSIPREPSPDPFLRSMALWMLQDYSGSLETLLVNIKPIDSSQSFDPAIFNFYFYLRSHPLLLKRKFPVKKGHSILPSPSVMQFSSQYGDHTLSGVGDDPFMPTERNLVFNTAYHQLNSGCPLLALIVLTKLPKDEDLGITDNPKYPSVVDRLLSSSGHVVGQTMSMAAIESGLLSSSLGSTAISEGESVRFFVGAPEDQVDMASSLGQHQLGAIKEEDEDWSKPMSRPVVEDDFDWSQLVSSQLIGDSENDLELSQQLYEREEESDKEASTSSNNEPTEDKTVPSDAPVSLRGMFILSLAEQLQYNALLSLLTEELATVHLPECCSYLWRTLGKDALPLLPQKGTDNESMMELFEREAFEPVLSNLQS